MAKFGIYESSGGMVVAAHAGWCWGGFLFGWIWAAVNGLWLYAGGHFLFLFVYYQILSMVIGQMQGNSSGSTVILLLLNVLGISVPIVYGLFGNVWLGNKLSAGGTLVDTIDAGSQQSAVMMYMQKKQLLSRN
jgi:hypothetical protein